MSRSISRTDVAAALLSAVLATALVVEPLPARSQNQTAGSCAPIVADAAGDVAVTVNCQFGGSAEPFEVTLLQAQLACNSETESRDLADTALEATHRPDPAMPLFEALQLLDDQFVYIDLSVSVGAGCGLDDVETEPAPRWGAIYDVAEALDGFTGDRERYEYGYRLEMDDYSETISNSRSSTILFPKDGDAFFSARFGKAMLLEGVAKIVLSDIQGFQVIEIIPATPVGGLADHYLRFRKALANMPR